MNEEQMIQVLEENAKIVAKLLVVLRHKNLLNDAEIAFIFNAELEDFNDDSLEIE